MMSNKKLVLIGSGIKTLSHLTEEAKAYIKQADLVLYLLNEPVLEAFIQQTNANHESLTPIYFKHKHRQDAYIELSDYILAQTANYHFVAVVMYGHPTIFASPGLNAIKQAEKEGIETLILPGISAEDCLFADLAIDPGNVGCVSLEATEFLIKKRLLDNHSHVIFWQMAMLGSVNHHIRTDLKSVLVLFLNKLLNYYDPDHIAYLYEAAIYPGVAPKIKAFALKNISEIEFSSISTVYIPPAKVASIDEEIFHNLNMDF